jgi:DNA processing protein
MRNKQFLVALQLVDGLGAVRLKMLLDFYHDPKIIWETPIEELSQFKIPQNVLTNLTNIRKTVDPQMQYERIINSGIQIVTLNDPEYPESLKQIHHPPVVLYIVGSIPALELSIGVVGTRQMTGYGKTVTRLFVKDLVTAGFVIISGLARGVDTTAHQTAIDESGQTIAVLGGGLNQIFPAENIHLAKTIVADHGAIISEYHPDAPALPGNFPSRNRIISGLSQAVLVTEAAKESGSLITAKIALEEGKTIYAVPGPITSFQSEGPLELIRDGATLVMLPKDILQDFGHLSSSKPNRSVEKLSTLEYQIISQLAKERTHLDDLTRLLGQTSAKVSASLLKLEIEGFVYNEGNGIYVKNL